MDARDGVRKVLFKRKVDDESINLSRKMDRNSKKTSTRKKVRNSKQHYMPLRNNFSGNFAFSYHRPLSNYIYIKLKKKAKK